MRAGLTTRKLLIYGLFQKGRVLAQDAVSNRHRFAGEGRHGRSFFGVTGTPLPPPISSPPKSGLPRVWLTFLALRGFVWVENGISG